MRLFLFLSSLSGPLLVLGFLLENDLDMNDRNILPRGKMNDSGGEAFKISPVSPSRRSFHRLNLCFVRRMSSFNAIWSKSGLYRETIHKSCFTYRSITKTKSTLKVKFSQTLSTARFGFHFSRSLAALSYDYLNCSSLHSGS